MNNFKKTTLSLVTAVAIGFTGCGSSSTDAGVTTDNTPLPTDTTTNNTPSTDTTLPASITTDMHLTSDKVWLLDGKVIVSNNATLTIDAGTTIAGNTPASFLAIAAGSKLNAIGTLDKPITFTSKKDVDGLSSDNSQGEWGGLILAGNAYTHYSNNVYEADPTINFGSADHAHDGDSSGDLEYVAIKHTGFKVSLDKELNGLSLAGVGSGTKIENIAIIGGADDAIEIWGGTVNLKNVYLYNGSDDSVDTDLGYRGTWENVLVQQVKLDSYNNHDSAAMETGNDGDTITTDDTNATQVHIINMTAYVKGADVSMKFDAGVILENVKFISDNVEIGSAVYYRGADVVNTGAMHVDGAVEFYNSNHALTADNAYAKINNKNDDNLTTAFSDWTLVAGHTALHMGSAGSYALDKNTIPGVNEANIWKGKAGTNDPLEDKTK